MLSKSSFVKNVFVVISGTAIGQIVGYGLYPIISRLYSPADFGVFGTFNAVLSIIAAGLTLDYSQAVMIPKLKDDAFNLCVLSCVTTIMITLCCLALCLLAPALIQNLMRTPHVWLLALLVVGVLVTGLNQACQAWCVRVKAFKHTSASQVVRSLSTNGTQIGLGYLEAGPPGLILAAILGEVLASLNLAREVFRDLRLLGRNIRLDRMWQLAKDYRDFPMYSASTNIISALSLGLAVLLLTHYYGIAVAGTYAFALRILSAPTEFVLRSLRQVLYQKASETHNEGGRLVPLYVKITSGLFAVAFFPSLVLFMWAPQIFTWAFGSQWLTAGEFARSLVLWMTFGFCNLPATLFTRIIRIQRKMFIYNLALLASRVLVLVAGGMYMPVSHTIILFSLVGAAMNIVYILIVGYVLTRKEGDASLNGFLNLKPDG